MGVPLNLRRAADFAQGLYSAQDNKGPDLSQDSMCYLHTPNSRDASVKTELHVALEAGIRLSSFHLTKIQSILPTRTAPTLRGQSELPENSQGNSLTNLGARINLKLGPRRS